jgi:hypothetical protein
VTERTASALRRLSEAGQPELAQRLDRFFFAVVDQAATDPSFAAALTAAMVNDPVAESRRSARSGGVKSTPPPAAKPGGTLPTRGGRRAAGPFDPHELYAENEDALRRRLNDCDIEQLKNIVAEHGMDHDRLAMKWKTPDRLIERIVDTVAARARKGEAFR